ncbi:hypothetical protein R4Z10_06985 [Niallia sp. XMNu-256]|uniref:hypothetical protein n=1 Tax=Niallia sp. XMNu-256 TaxID=3082444 RepID=UPI0030D1099A
MYRKDSKQQEHYDAIFVLVNPGLCTPKQSTYQIPHVTIGEGPINFIPAKTDNTQYQVMRFMELKQWKKVLLLNLSDIRSGNLSEFKEKLDDANRLGFESHTIFSPLRTRELKLVLLKCLGSVILAWGTDSKVKSLAKLALNTFPHAKIVGLEYKQTPYYYHASPLRLDGKIRWLENMNDRIS